MTASWPSHGQQLEWTGDMSPQFQRIGRIVGALLLVQALIAIPVYSEIRIMSSVVSPDFLMTVRYMQHAPESYFAEDAARVAGSLTGERDREGSAHLARARRGSP